jgi:hypothetical protein
MHHADRSRTRCAATTRRTRGSPKQADSTLSAFHAPRTARETSKHPRRDPGDRSRETTCAGRCSTHSRRSHATGAQSHRSSAEQARSRRRGSRTRTERCDAEATHHPLWLVITRMVTAVQAHPSRSTSHPKTAHRTLASASASGARGVQRHFTPQSPKRPKHGNHSGSARADPRATATSATSSSARKHRKNAPSNKRDTIGACPKTCTQTCSSPAVGARRPLPWGSSPFDGISVGDRCAGLPPRHLPLSGFLTLSAV